jgi:hypothetical protein
MTQAQSLAFKKKMNSQNFKTKSVATGGGGQFEK